METLFNKNRVVVAIALIAALVIGAVNAVVFSSWRDNVIIEQGRTIEQQGRTIEQQNALIAALITYDELLASGACYGVAANSRIDYAFVGVPTRSSDILLGPEQFESCLRVLERITAVRFAP